MDAMEKNETESELKDESANHPEPNPQPAEPTFEILDDPPAVLRRPLQIIDEHAYAMTRLHVKAIITEGLDEKGKIIQYNPPLEKVNPALRVIRDDGVMFGEGTKNNLQKLGFDVSYPDFVPDEKFIPPKAVRDLDGGIHPDPVETFEQIVEIVDQFFDFNHSLADQRTMCEFIAAYILATWFIEGFNVAGYLWITGGRGSGKTQLLMLIAELAYLGYVVLASSSLPTLRDLSGVGAFLGFDDAENYSSTSKSDPDKRALFLAGNRRGSTITLKEPLPNGRGWTHRSVSTFSHRAFTATSKPESILSSRAVVIPLVRTSNRAKANSDPLDDRTWPYPPQQLRSELWQIALTNLMAMREFEQEISSRASLTGRDLEAWRGVLTIASWLDSLDTQDKLKRAEEGSVNDVKGGLFDRLDQVSLEYQALRGDFEMNDYTRLVLSAIVSCVLSGDHGSFAEMVEPEQLQDVPAEFYLTTREITVKARMIVEGEGLDFNLEWVDRNRVGRAVSQLRFTKKRLPGRGNAGWQIKRKDLEDLLVSYSLMS